ncbi:PAS domain S-box protein [Mesobacillus selenatarsenatis]|uniref:RsbR, positive regulator of sigma-B n=1 Tax=Mesobacillus selenatarsenatis (strain DSM 18680 / JCM 14380 / FERM P-15431 / SF-1) TaxID=1321606 RepID=A0A0A8WXM8_MESS1|nr:PAS domain S-box protein [Mesobacillus selenatarsenatis]GAM12395.1 RsbR, positive regulator of sigma-B [Mesobacillus selenatarsenatis SF-1]
MSENIEGIDYKEVIEYALDPLIVHTQLKIIYINEAAEKFFRASRDEVIGASPLDIFKDSSKPAITKRISGAYNEPAELIEETIYRMDETQVEVELYCHPIKIGETKAIQTYVKDITERKQQEKAQYVMNRQIDELASNIVPLLKGIAVLPLLGAINQDRAEQLLELVPANVQEQEVRSLIIDCSGIYKIDNLVIDSLFKLSNVLKLIGVKCIITGVRPELAVEAVKLGINLENVKTFSGVKEALYFLGLNNTK